jgi:hypothetical protein
MNVRVKGGMGWVRKKSHEKYEEQSKLHASLFYYGRKAAVS